MTEPQRTDFERRLEGRLLRLVQVDVRPFDPDAIAADAMRRRGSGLGGVLLAAALLAVALIGAWLLAGGSQRPNPFGVASPTPGTASPTASGPSGVATVAALEGTWIAERPSTLDLAIGEAVGPLSLVFDANGVELYVAGGGATPRLLTSDASLPSGGVLRVDGRAATGPMADGATTLAGCAAGARGSYGLTRSSDGLLLTLRLIEDACESRPAVLARTWTRSLGSPSSGGTGVVTSLATPFVVTLPAGSYRVDDTPGSVTIHQDVPEFQLVVVRDPQGFLDPCDPGSGRRAIAPGADALVAYFRSLDGVVVDAVQPLEVDGHPATRLAMHATLDVGCANNRLAEYQPKAASGDFHFFVEPGVADSVVIVELPDTTLMFEVLPAPHPLEEQVIGSIRFLDRLPNTP